MNTNPETKTTAIQRASADPRLLAIAASRGWHCEEVFPPEDNCYLFQIKLPSGNWSAFQFNVSTLADNITEFAQYFDPDEYAEKVYSSNPERSIREVLSDADFLAGELVDLSCDMQMTDYYPLYSADKVLEICQQKGWTGCYHAKEGLDATLILSKALKDVRFPDRWCFSMKLRAEHAWADLITAVSGFDREDTAVSFAAIYGGQMLNTKDAIPEEWLKLADQVYSELTALNSELVVESRNQLRTKDLWMRCGISFPLNSWEMEQVDRQSEYGKKILEKCFAEGRYRLDGETYTPSNAGKAIDGEWEHGDIELDF